ncbi:MAG: hypothetical protein QW334_02500 [Thermofilum sp.]
MVRKIGIALVVVGLAVFVFATVSLISERLSLPPWSVETEGRWTAYGLSVWGYVIGELPLSLALVLAGLLLWPPRPRSLVAKVQGSLSLVIALIGLAALACLVHTLIETGGFEPSPPSVLLGILVYFVPMSVITVLATMVAWRRLSIKEILLNRRRSNLWT